MTTSKDKDVIVKLASLSELEYEKVREKEANNMGVRVSVLDSEVQKKRAENTNDSDTDELVKGVKPWHEEVDGNQLLTEMRALFNRYCVLPSGCDVALSMWSLASYNINQFRIFPKVCLSSPEKRCGKTTALEVMGAVTNKALIASNLSPSVLFRSIDAWQPTLLIDEADTFLAGKEELRGVINSGHTRKAAFVLRTEGDSGERRPVKFSTWSPMVIAMIKMPPGTIRDRSIMIKLRRKLNSESVARLPYDLENECVTIRRKCKRWSDDYATKLKRHRPEVPKVSSDRAMDNWLPLLSIADVIGGDWPDLARRAMIQIEQSYSTNESTGQKLLADIQMIFTDRRIDKIFSVDLVSELVRIELSPWAEWVQGKPLTKYGLSKQLKSFGISPNTIRIGGETLKGYYLKSFNDAFSRYLTETPIQPVTTSHFNEDTGCSDFQSVTSAASVTDEKGLKASSSKGCDVVTDRKWSYLRVIKSVGEGFRFVDKRYYTTPPPGAIQGGVHSERYFELYSGWLL